MAMLNNQMVIHINWIYWLQVLRIITALWHHLVTLQGPWHSPLPSLLPQGFRASPRCKGLHRRLTRKFWISLCNYMIYNTIYIYNIYIYIYVNSWIPVPDMLFGQLLEVLRCRLQRFKKAWRRAAVFSLLRWGLEPNIAFGRKSLEIQWELFIL